MVTRISLLDERSENIINSIGKLNGNIRTSISLLVF